MDIKAEDAQIKARVSAVLPYLNERQRRLFVAVEANAIGHGGVARLSRITGMSRPTIGRGQKELRENKGAECFSKRARAKGSGRKKRAAKTHSAA